MTMNEESTTLRQKLLTKIALSIERDGLIGAATRVLSMPSRIIGRRTFHKTVLPRLSAEEKFTWIYKNNFWEDGESLSGSGSTIKYTENLRAVLPKVFQAFEIKSVFDAPCGDFNWMRHLFPRSDVAYIGGDIVRPLIDDLNRKYKADGLNFIHFDLTKSVPPKADLMIVRDCLFHLSYADTKAFLDNFCQRKRPTY